MKLLSLIPLLAIVTWVPGHAATLAFSTDRTRYQFGETVTVNVTGDAMGQSATDVFARALWTTPVALSHAFNVSQVPMTSFGGQLQWATGFLQSGGGFATVLNQFVGAGGGFVPLIPDGPFQASFQVQMGGGYMIFYFDESPGPGQLDFFDASWEPYTIFETEVPEPTTAALLTLGLLALRAARQRPAA